MADDDCEESNCGAGLQPCERVRNVELTVVAVTGRRI
jgi:hypothetical protein